MKNSSLLATLCVAVCLSATQCSSPSASTETKTETATTETMAAKPDMAAIKTEIQAIEKEFELADNARDVKKIGDFYADDAISMVDHGLSLVGREAIMKHQEESFAKRSKGETISFETLDVFGDGIVVTEVGKSISRDSTGKQVYSGKYMAIWEKRDGKYLTIREIYNSDKEEK
jgi:uncharacterized protein (TIGR02246 family)